MRKGGREGGMLGMRTWIKDPDGRNWWLLSLRPFLSPPSLPSSPPKPTSPVFPSKSSTSSNLYDARKPCNFFFSSTLMVDSSSLKSSNSSARVFCFCALSAQGLEACRLKAEEEEGEGRVRKGELLLRSDDCVEGRRKL